MKFPILIAFSATLALFTACGTVTPDPQPLTTVVVSYDGEHENGGITAVQLKQGDNVQTVDTSAGPTMATKTVQAQTKQGGNITGLVLTGDARERYNELVDRYGREVYGRDYPRDYGLTKLDDNAFLATREAGEMFSVLNQVWKMDGCPTK